MAESLASGSEVAVFFDQRAEYVVARGDSEVWPTAGGGGPSADLHMARGIAIGRYDLSKKLKGDWKSAHVRLRAGERLTIPQAGRLLADYFDRPSLQDIVRLADQQLEDLKRAAGQ